MLTKSLLRDIILQQKNEGFSAEGTVKRDILDSIMRWIADRRVMILTGLRRSGKSTLLKQLMSKTHGYCYVNFEDERFIDFMAQEFEQLNEVLAEVYNNPRIYFFDEVQNVKNFEAFVRRLHEQGKKVIITGSNASLLSREFGAKLTGRYRQFEVYPFSFAEFLSFRGIMPEKDWCHITEKKVMLIRLLDDYISNGGMPEYLKNHDREYIRTVYEGILYRDIIARYGIKRQRVIKELVNILSTNIALPFTYNSLKKSLGLSNSITIKEYVSYLSSSYFFFELQKFDFSVRRQLGSPKKIYIIDSAFSQISGFNFSANAGRLIENMVFIELKRRNKEVYYFSGRNECDFVVKAGAKIKEAIQVCHTISEDNKEREAEGLLEAMEKFGLSKGIILTKEQDALIKIKGKGIRVLPVWKWLLGYE